MKLFPLAFFVCGTLVGLVIGIATAPERSVVVEKLVPDEDALRQERHACADQLDKYAADLEEAYREIVDLEEECRWTRKRNANLLAQLRAYEAMLKPKMAAR